VLELVISSLRTLETETEPGLDLPDITEDTKLIAAGAMLDSLGLVTLVIEVEQSLEQEYDLRLTLANDRALSMRHSPFRTVGSLTDYIMSLIAEGP
jgi:acyl carrier protein